MKSLSVEELAIIQQRHEKSTEGGWMVGYCNEDWSTLGSPICRMDENDSVLVGLPGDWGRTNDPKADAEFIANAHEDIPRLVSEVCRLRRMVIECGMTPDLQAESGSSEDEEELFKPIPIEELMCLESVKHFPYRDAEHQRQSEAEFMNRCERSEPLPPMSPEMQAIYDRNKREIDEMVARGECHPCAS